MKTGLAATLLLFHSALCFAQDTPAALHFPGAGFSIAPLEDGGAPRQALMMFLSPVDGFAPNVNVGVQPYAGTMDEYVKLSKEQFAAAGVELVQEQRLGANEAIIEYRGPYQDQKLHWYAKAVLSGSRVYLTTATSTEARWEELAARLKACVDSFRMTSSGP